MVDQLNQNTLDSVANGKSVIPTIWQKYQRGGPPLPLFLASRGPKGEYKSTRLYVYPLEIYDQI